MQYSVIQRTHMGNPVVEILSDGQPWGADRLGPAHFSFGSLDPEALEIAIAALEGLRQEEKTIGVISHVEVLKERIGTQVVVEKQAGGISTLRVMAA